VSFTKYFKNNTSTNIKRKFTHLGKRDIIVGVMSKNVEDSISYVLENIDRGLQKYFPNKRNLILISDGFSKDKTFENVKTTETETEKIFVEQVGNKGKGNGIKTLFLVADILQAKAIATFDGDLISIRPQWVKCLLEPILSGKDLVIPFYQRNKYDGRITNHIVYPFIKSYFGINIRQPIGGEYGFSLRFIKKLLLHPKFPENFGIDIFITTVGICEGFKIVIQELGSKSHSSTKKYNEVDGLERMFKEVVAQMFDMAIYYKNSRKCIQRKIPIYENGFPRCESEVRIDTKKLEEIAKYKIEKLNDIIENILPMTTYKKIQKCIKDGVGIPSSLWSDIIFNSFRSLENGYHLDDIVTSLIPLWHARTKAFVEEVKNLSDEEAENNIEELVQNLKNQFI